MCKREAVITNTEIFQQGDIYVLGSDSSLKKYLDTKELAEGEPKLDENGNFHPEVLKKMKEHGLL